MAIKDCGRLGKRPTADVDSRSFVMPALWTGSPILQIPLCRSMSYHSAAMHPSNTVIHNGYSNMTFEWLTVMGYLDISKSRTMIPQGTSI